MEKVSQTGLKTEATAAGRPVGAEALDDTGEECAQGCAADPHGRKTEMTENKDIVKKAVGKNADDADIE